MPFFRSRIKLGPGCWSNVIKTRENLSISSWRPCRQLICRSKKYDSYRVSISHLKRASTGFCLRQFWHMITVVHWDLSVLWEVVEEGVSTKYCHVLVVYDTCSRYRKKFRKLLILY